MKLGRLIVITLVLIVLIWALNGFTKLAPVDRAIVLGVGIDKLDDGNFELTFEAVGFDREKENSVKSIVASSTGVSMAECLQAVFDENGIFPSLSLTNIIIVGKSVQGDDLATALNFFTQSYNFRDGTLIAAARDTAKELFTDKKSKNFRLVSESIINCLTFTHTKSNPQNDKFLTFLINLYDIGGTGGIAVIDYEEAGEGKFNYFHKTGRMFSLSKVEEIDETQTHGIRFLTFPNASEIYPVKDAETDEPKEDLTLMSISKKIKQKLEFDGQKASVHYDIDVRLYQYYADFYGELSRVEPKQQRPATEGELQLARKQMEDFVGEAISYQKSTDLDALKISDKFYRKYGKKWLQFFEDKDFNDVEITYSINVRSN